jgi:hypothetical protein
MEWLHVLQKAETTQWPVIAGHNIHSGQPLLRPAQQLGTEPRVQQTNWRGYETKIIVDLACGVSLFWLPFTFWCVESTVHRDVVTVGGLGS